MNLIASLPPEQEVIGQLAIRALAQFTPSPSIPDCAATHRDGSAKALYAARLRACAALTSRRHTAGELAEIEADQARRVRNMGGR